MGIILLSFVFMQYNEWIIFNKVHNSFENGIKLAKDIILGIKYSFNKGFVLGIIILLLFSIFIG